MLGGFFRSHCTVCDSKDQLIEKLETDLSRERTRLDQAERKLNAATDALLADQGKPSLTLPPRMTATDADRTMQDIFAIFKDEDDKGDGKVLDSDQVGQG